MKKTRWRWLAILLVCWICSLSFAFAEVNLPNPTREFYVGDFADILSSETEAWIIQTNLNYERTAERPQVVVVTVPDLQGMTIESYAVALFEKWGIGNKEYDNGVLLLLSVGDRQIRIEVGMDWKERFLTGVRERSSDMYRKICLQMIMMRV